MCRCRHDPRTPTMKSQINPISGLQNDAACRRYRACQPWWRRPRSPRCRRTAKVAWASYLAYPTEIDGRRLNPDCFEVSERSVTDVFTATGADPRTRAPSGHHVLSVCRWMTPLPHCASSRHSELDRVRRCESYSSASGLRCRRPDHKSTLRQYRQVRDVHTATEAVLSPFDEPLRTSFVRDWSWRISASGYSTTPKPATRYPTTCSCQLTTTGHRPIRWSYSCVMPASRVTTR